MDAAELDAAGLGAAELYTAELAATKLDTAELDAAEYDEAALLLGNPPLTKANTSVTSKTPAEAIARGLDSESSSFHFHNRFLQA